MSKWVYTEKGKVDLSEIAKHVKKELSGDEYDEIANMRRVERKIESLELGPSSSDKLYELLEIEKPIAGYTYTEYFNNMEEELNPMIGYNDTRRVHVSELLAYEEGRLGTHYLHLDPGDAVSGYVLEVEKYTNEIGTILSIVPDDSPYHTRRCAVHSVSENIKVGQNVTLRGVTDNLFGDLVVEEGWHGELLDRMNSSIQLLEKSEITLFDHIISKDEVDLEYHSKIEEVTGRELVEEYDDLKKQLKYSREEYEEYKKKNRIYFAIDKFTEHRYRDDHPVRKLLQAYDKSILREGHRSYEDFHENTSFKLQDIEHIFFMSDSPFCKDKHIYSSKSGLLSEHRSKKVDREIQEYKKRLDAEYLNSQKNKSQLENYLSSRAYVRHLLEHSNEIDRDLLHSTLRSSDRRIINKHLEKSRSVRMQHEMIHQREESLSKGIE